MLIEIDRQDADEHEHRSGQGIQEKLDGGIKLSGAAPYSDQEIHGNQHDFPEHIKDQEIERHEDAEHSGLKQEHESVVFLDALLDGRP